MDKSTMVTAAFVAAGLMAPGVARAEGPTLHANGTPYRVETAPATGRSGNANLTVRALLNKDESTDVDVTTGTLDATTAAPGSMAKVQVKTYNGAGDVQWTKNYSGLSGVGSVHYNFPDLHRGQPIQTQANINGIDPRTDVVTVSGNVKLRPDPAMTEVTAPSKANIGAIVNIAGTVTEKNGDVGAQGDCTLLVDGTPADQALGVYVDSGSTVTCAFSYRFETAGTHSLEVRFGNVVPGDWDTSNNAAQTTIEILQTAPFYYSAGASIRRYGSNSTNVGHYQYANGTWSAASDWSTASASEQFSESAYISGWSPTALKFPLAHVQSTFTADGLVVNTVSRDTVDAQYSWGDASYGSAHASIWDPATYSYIYVTSYKWGSYGGTYANAARYAGAVTYYSAGHQKYWFGYVGGANYTYSYSWNYDYAFHFGKPWPMATTMAFDFAVTDANGTQISASPSVALRSYDYSQSTPLTCRDWSWTWGSEHYCYSSAYTSKGASGYTSGVSNP